MFVEFRSPAARSGKKPSQKQKEEEGEEEVEEEDESTPCAIPDIMNNEQGCTGQKYIVFYLILDHGKKIKNHVLDKIVAKFVTLG